MPAKTQYDGERTVYFLGAGASKQDRFPLTYELKYGISWAILKEPSRFRLLAEHLQYLYSVDDADLLESSKIWEDIKNRAGAYPTPVHTQVPDVTDFLSTLEWMIREQGSFGPGLNSLVSPHSATGELALIRDLVVQALCFCLGTYDNSNAGNTTPAFINMVRPEDSIITTNWDLLLDTARDLRFGSQALDYGTSGNVILEYETKPKTNFRPLLLKLHGSLSWRYCQRCQRLVIDPRRYVAGDRVTHAQCECTSRFSELIVTPGFVREYKNVHLLNIWREALLTLAAASQWVFIGYSLPPDDVGIRTLLLKARCMRHDLGGEAPLVKIITGPYQREQTLSRYKGILPQATLYPGDFAHFAERANAAVA
ncbi:MAG: SIR2 family protein [Chitinophagaceae bacterium]